MWVYEDCMKEERGMGRVGRLLSTRILHVYLMAMLEPNIYDRHSGQSVKMSSFRVHFRQPSLLVSYSSLEALFNYEVL